MRSLSSRFWSDPHLKTVALLAFLLVWPKKWEPGGNLDALWYCAIAKNIFETGNFFHFFISRYDYTKFYDHMPLLYWVTAGLFKLFGPSDFVARLFPMLCSSMSYLLVYLIGKNIRNADFGLTAVLVYTLCFGNTKWNGAVLHDVPLTTFSLGLTYFFILALRKPVAYYLSAICFALGVFTKGPIILGVAGAIVFSLLLKRDSTPIRQRHFWGALGLLAALLALPFLPALQFDGHSIYYQFYVWKKAYFVPGGQSMAERLGYLRVLLVADAILFPLILGTLLSKTKEESSSPLADIPQWASLFILIPLSLFKTKFPHYLLPAYPFLALWGAGAALRWFRPILPKVELWTQRFCFAAVFILIALPIKISGSRPRDLLNLIDVIKFDSRISQKQVGFWGGWPEDMMSYQQFKFYGSIDPLPVMNESALGSLDLKNAYLIVKKSHLPLHYHGRLLDSGQCGFSSGTYCAITLADDLQFEFPDNALPHEVFVFHR